MIETTLGKLANANEIISKLAECKEASYKEKLFLIKLIKAVSDDTLFFNKSKNDIIVEFGTKLDDNGNYSLNFNELDNDKKNEYLTKMNDLFVVPVKVALDKLKYDENSKLPLSVNDLLLLDDFIEIVDENGKENEDVND